MATGIRAWTTWAAWASKEADGLILEGPDCFGGRALILFIWAYNLGMGEIVFEVRDADEGGFIARAVGQGIVTEADTIEELKAMIRDAVRVHFDPGTEPALIRMIRIVEEVFAA